MRAGAVRSLALAAWAAPLAAQAPDDGARERHLLIAGVNAWPTAVTEFQVNYLVDPDDASPERHRLLVNVQFGF